MPTRLEFTVADLMRVRVASSLGPLAETALVFSRLQTAPTPWPAPTLGRKVTQHLYQQAKPSERALASYLWLGPTAGLDFFTVGGHTSSFSAGQEAILDAPGDVWASEVDAWAELRAEARRRGLLALPVSGRDDAEAVLRGGRADSWQKLLAWMQDRYTSWIGPRWPSIKDQLDAEEARLAHHAAAGGLQGLAAALAPSVRWTGSTLDIPETGITGTHTGAIQLGGRGLTIVPSFFALRPMTFVPAEPTNPVLLIVPCRFSEMPTSRPSADAPRGAELLGRTRAAVLNCVAQKPRTTSELSRDLAIAIGGASHHAAVLRRAGLITTTREGGHVQHCITELGIDLLTRSRLPGGWPRDRAH